MKSIVCEMCGSNDFVKQDGMVVCQHCGTKYTVEEARKLMVTIDNSSKMNNLAKIAKQAQSEGNYEKAGKYYDMILQEDADNWRAAFYSVYDAGMCCRIAEIENASYSVANCIPHVLQLIKAKHYDVDSEYIILSEIATAICQFISQMFVATQNHFKQFRSTEGANKEKQNRVEALIALLFHTGDCIEVVFADNSKVCAEIPVMLWKTGVTAYENTMMPTPPGMDEHIEKIKKYNPSYTCKKSTNTSGGCYIATAVYGSYDCPQVWTLRRFRDYSLAKSCYGRTFIRVYYTISPVLVKYFGETKWFKTFWEKRLDKMVRKLQAQGYESSPYND